MFNKNKRIVDKSAIEKARKKYCEVCGRTDMAIEVHHIKSKGSGGHDIQENLISLCWECHKKAHNVQISKDKLFEIARLRNEQANRFTTSNRFTF